MNIKKIINLHITSNRKANIRGRIVGLLTVTLLSFCLTGCGSKELDTYKEDVTTFIDNVTVLNDNINSIDVTSETRVTDFLSYMDELSAEFTRFAELEVPEQFASIETLADDAGTYMSEAVALYHQAFEAEVLDTTILDIASQNYQRANKRIDYIATILQGELPDDESVTVEYVDEDLNEEPDLETEEE